MTDINKLSIKELLDVSKNISNLFTELQTKLKIFNKDRNYNIFLKFYRGGRDYYYKYDISKDTFTLILNKEFKEFTKSTEVSFVIYIIPMYKLDDKYIKKGVSFNSDDDIFKAQHGRVDFSIYGSSSSLNIISRNLDSSKIAKMSLFSDKEDINPFIYYNEYSFETYVQIDSVDTEHSLFSDISDCDVDELKLLIIFSDLNVSVKKEY